MSLEPSVNEGGLEGDYYIDSRRLGDRNRAPDKSDKDCKLLLDVLAEHPDDARATFYLAQTYFDAGNPREALRYYTQRAGMGGWDEEVFYARYRAAACLALLGEPWVACQDAYLNAFQQRPWRAEPLHAVARHHRIARDFDLGYVFARAADEIAFPDADALFVARDVHAWRSADERAICAYYT